MKKWIVTLAALLIASPAFAADPSNGLWKTEPGETGGYLHVRISDCNANVCGIIEAAYDVDNAIADDYEHLGKPIIWDMQVNGDGTYKKGKIWAPDDDKTYGSKMVLSGNVLKVSGCVWGLCRSQDWQRVN